MDKCVKYILTSVTVSKQNKTLLKESRIEIHPESDDEQCKIGDPSRYLSLVSGIKS